MSLSVSQESIKQAYEEANKHIHLTNAEREKNLFSKEGMQLRIPQDNALDTLINSIDGRRIKLEKKAEILHDFYGDRLLAKDLFKDYLEQKKYKSGVANLLTASLLAANAYTRIMRNSVFMGKLGTVAIIAAVQCVGRNLSNNWLEEKIDRPWKIHTYRQSNGLSATNVRSNKHREVLNYTLDFDNKVNYNIEDDLFNAKVDYKLYNTHFKTPLIQDNYPYAPDEDDINLFNTYEVWTPDRIKKQMPDKKDVAYMGDNSDFLRNHMPIPFKQDRPNYDVFVEVCKIANGFSTVYKPDYSRKYSAFEAVKPEDQLGDQIIVHNEYTKRPDDADIQHELPTYSQHFGKLVNFTPERLEQFKFDWMQRLKFKEVKKQIAEIIRQDGDETKINKLLKDFQEQYRKEQAKFFASRIQIIDESEPVNKVLLNDEEDLKFYEKYFNLIYKNRPEMTKEVPEGEKRFDFPIDAENYDPWDEYKSIYSGIYKKGKIHWLLAKMPEWRFLQIRQQSEANEDVSTNPRNRLKPNMDDSIFNVIALDRYFDERLMKQGTYRGRSQSIRI